MKHIHTQNGRISQQSVGNTQWVLLQTGWSWTAQCLVVLVVPPTPWYTFWSVYLVSEKVREGLGKESGYMKDWHSSGCSNSSSSTVQTHTSTRDWEWCNWQKVAVRERENNLSKSILTWLNRTWLLSLSLLPPPLLLPLPEHTLDSAIRERKREKVRAAAVQRYYQENILSFFFSPVFIPSLYFCLYASLFTQAKKYKTKRGQRSEVCKQSKKGKA